MRLADARVPGLPAVLDRADVVEVELNGPLPDGIMATQPHVAVLARLCGQPLGIVLMPAEQAVSAAGIAAAVETELGSQLARELPHHGLDSFGLLEAGGIPHADCPVRTRRAELARSGPAISVILCTRERPEPLKRCLESLFALEYHDFEIVVVDNRPVTDATRLACVESAAAQPDTAPALRYVVETRPGLSHARNTGVSAALHEIVAFVDDDERIDSGWLAGLAAEFVDDQAVGCTSGIVLPAELLTTAQVRFEQFGGHSKGRGFQRVRFDADYLDSVQSAMYPLPPFGVGANMAFRKSAIASFHGFDIALGAGTPIHGSEDTHAFTEVMLAGWRMVYTPAAITWHYHRRDDAALDDQLSGYALGLGAYYVALLLRDPRRLSQLIRLLPRAARDLRDPASARNASAQRASDPVPGLSIRGVCVGAWRYALIRVRHRMDRLRPFVAKGAPELRG